jgi:hypothetical protein
MLKSFFCGECGEGTGVPGAVARRFEVNRTEAARRPVGTETARFGAPLAPHAMDGEWRRETRDPGMPGIGDVMDERESEGMRGTACPAAWRAVREAAGGEAGGKIRASSAVMEALMSAATTRRSAAPSKAKEQSRARRCLPIQWRRFAMRSRSHAARCFFSRQRRAYHEERVFDNSDAATLVSTVWSGGWMRMRGRDARRSCFWERRR